MKKLFPIALIAFIAVIGTSCKKEVQEVKEVPEQTIKKVKTESIDLPSDPEAAKHWPGCKRYYGDYGCVGCKLPK